MSGWLLILALLILGGVLSTLGDRLGSRVGKGTAQPVQSEAATHRLC